VGGVEREQPDDHSDAARPAHGMVRRVLQAVLSIGLGVAVLVFVIPQFADLSQVWAEVQAMTGLELAVLAAFATWNLVTYAIQIVICTPGISFRQAFVSNEATTAVSNTVPAGGAVSIGLNYAMLGSWGFSKSRITLSVIVSGIWNNFAKLALPIFAVALLALQGGAGQGRLLTAAIGFGALVAAVVVFALVLRSADFAARTGTAAARMMSRLRGIVRKRPVAGWDDAVVKFRSRVIGLVSRRWVSLTVWTIIGHLSLFAVLLVALRGIGVSEAEVSAADALAVFAFARLLTAIPLTPGGLGVVEVALIAGLDAAGGGHAQVVGAVLLFRVLTYVLPIPLGLGCYIFWRRNRSWIGSAPPLVLEPA
jgi:uncharacterized protein (TIRG00374 family)